MVWVWGDKIMEGIIELSAGAAIFSQMEVRMALVTHFCHVGWISAIFFQFISDGIRIPLFISCVINFLCFSYYLYVTEFYTQPVPDDNYSILIMSIIQGGWWLMMVKYTAYAGPGDFSKLRPSGPFHVGVKYVRTETLGNECLVFFPMGNSPAIEEKISSGSYKEAFYFNNPKP